MKSERPPRPGRHFHVDLFCGPEGEYVRGLRLVETAAEQPVETLSWAVVDDFGVLGPRNSQLFVAPTLEEALRLALAALRAHLEPPCVPVWKTAPYELLGYRRGSRGGADRVGLDGLPEAADGGGRVAR